MPYRRIVIKLGTNLLTGGGNCLDEAMMASLAEQAARLHALGAELILVTSGAIASGPSRFPVPYRDASWAVHPFGIWEDPADDERCVEWVRKVREDVRPWSTGAVYLNFIGDEGTDRVAAGLGEDNMRRLAAVRAEYDPDNVFRFNHNIAPVPAGA